MPWPFQLFKTPRRSPLSLNWRLSFKILLPISYKAPDFFFQELKSQSHQELWKGGLRNPKCLSQPPPNFLSLMSHQIYCFLFTETQKSICWFHPLRYISQWSKMSDDKVVVFTGMTFLGRRGLRVDDGGFGWIPRGLSSCLRIIFCKKGLNQNLPHFHIASCSLLSLRCFFTQTSASTSLMEGVFLPYYQYFVEVCPFTQLLLMYENQ